MINRACLFMPLIAVAGFAQADTTLYGSLRLSVAYVEDKYHGDIDKYKNTDVHNDSSRFGIKGHEDLGDGLSAFYTYEFGVNADKASITDKDANRLSFVGLKHDKWGAVAIGAQWSPYYNLLSANDIFNADFSYDEYTYLGPFRLTDVVSYASPNWGGFETQMAVIFNGESDNTHDNAGSDAGIDAANIGLSYKTSGWLFGFSYVWGKEGYLDEAAQGSYDLYGAVIGYSNERFELALVGESVNYDDNDNNPYEFNLAGTYHLTEDDKLRALIGMVDNDVDSEEDDKSYRYALGYEHNFSKRTRVWAEYSYLDAGDQFNELKSQNWIDFGIRSDF